MQEIIYVLAPPVVAFAACFPLWLAYGRDTKIDRAVYPIYKAPKGLGVLECGILLDDVMNRKDLAYELYNLALNDIVRIEEGSYAYLLVSPESDEYKELTGGQRKLLETLFSHSFGKIKTPAMRLKSLHVKTAKVKAAIYDYLTGLGYYEASPQQQRGLFYMAASLLMSGGILWNIVTFFSLFDMERLERANKNNFFLFLPGWLLLGLFLAGFVVGICGSFMGRKTAEGVKRKLEIYGFREFIITAERDRIELFAKEQPEQYRKVLPFAFLFGVGEKWAIDADDLAQLAVNEHLRTVTADIDPETIEEAFEEKKNILVFIINVLLKTVIEGTANSAKGYFYRNFDRNGEYRSVIDREFSDKMDMEKLLEFSAHLPPEAQKKLVEKSVDEMTAGRKKGKVI